MDVLTNIILPIVYFLITSVAVYLSFKRNRGFNLGPFLAALFFSPLYIIYALAVPIKAPKKL